MNAVNRPDVLARFWIKVNKNGPIHPALGTACWLWTGSRFSNDYGSFWFGDRLGRAHRFSYELHVGPIPPGLCIDHLCRVRCCVNPVHLEPVTNRQNVIRGKLNFPYVAISETACIRGHEYNDTNTRRTLRCERACRVCDHDRQVAFREANRDVVKAKKAEYYRTHREALLAQRASRVLGAP